MTIYNLWQLIKWNWFSITGGVLCCFPVSFKESERPGCGYALTHSSFHVQGVFIIFSVDFLGPRGPHSWSTSVRPFVRKKSDHLYMPMYALDRHCPLHLADLYSPVWSCWSFYTPSHSSWHVQAGRLCDSIFRGGGVGGLYLGSY